RHYPLIRSSLAGTKVEKTDSGQGSAQPPRGSRCCGCDPKSGGSMRSDSEIKRDVEDELRWDPDIDPTDIAVAVKSGVVTLTGFVRSYRRNLQPNVRPSAWRGSSASPMISKCAYPMRTRDPILK